MTLTVASSQPFAFQTAILDALCMVIGEMILCVGMLRRWPGLAGADDFHAPVDQKGDEQGRDGNGDPVSNSHNSVDGVVRGSVQCGRNLCAEAKPRPGIQSSPAKIGILLPSLNPATRQKPLFLAHVPEAFDGAFQAVVKVFLGRVRLALSRLGVSSQSLGGLAFFRFYHRGLLTVDRLYKSQIEKEYGADGARPGMRGYSA